MFSGRRRRPSSVGRATIDGLPPELEDERRQLEAFVACAIAFGGDDPAGLRFLEPVRTRPVASYGDRCLAAMAALQWIYAGGTGGRGVRAALAALRGGELHERDNGLLPTIAIYVLEYAEREEALPAWEREMTVAHARGSLLGANAVHLWYGWSLLRRGDLRDAEAFEREALVDTERYNSRGAPVTGFPLANLIDILLARGELHAAYALFGRGEHILAERSNAGRFMRRARLQLMLALGRHDEAARQADAIAIEDAWNTHAGDAPWRSLAAQAYAALGRTDDALEVAEGDLERARRFGAPGGIGLALRTLGELRGDVELLESAVAVLDGSPRRLERARALTSLGTALRQADRGAAARDVLVRACAEASICGAAGVLEAATTELRAAGGEPDPAAATGPGALTTLERRVAALASAGADVIEIAQAAFLTPHAVEVHLDGVRRKLGSASPDELMAALV